MLTLKAQTATIRCSKNWTALVPVLNTSENVNKAGWSTTSVETPGV